MGGPRGESWDESRTSDSFQGLEAQLLGFDHKVRVDLFLTRCRDKANHLLLLIFDLGLFEDYFLPQNELRKRQFLMQTLHHRNEHLTAHI